MVWTSPNSYDYDYTIERGPETLEGQGDEDWCAPWWEWPDHEIEALEREELEEVVELAGTHPLLDWYWGEVREKTGFHDLPFADFDYGDPLEDIKGFAAYIRPRATWSDQEGWLYAMGVEQQETQESRSERDPRWDGCEKFSIERGGNTFHCTPANWTPPHGVDECECEELSPTQQLGSVWDDSIGWDGDHEQAELQEQQWDGDHEQAQEQQWDGDREQAEWQEQRGEEWWGENYWWEESDESEMEGDPGLQDSAHVQTPPTGARTPRNQKHDKNQQNKSALDASVRYSPITPEGAKAFVEKAWSGKVSDSSQPCSSSGPHELQDSQGIDMPTPRDLVAAQLEEALGDAPTETLEGALSCEAVHGMSLTDHMMYVRWFDSPSAYKARMPAGLSTRLWGELKCIFKMYHAYNVECPRDVLFALKQEYARQ